MERFAGWFLTKPSKDAVMHVYWSRAAFASRKCWGARDTICGHKAKDITPSIAWRREAWKEEALDDLPWKDERGPSSTRRTLELFQRQRWGNFWETRWSAYIMGSSERVYTILNWNEMKWTDHERHHLQSSEANSIVWMLESDSNHRTCRQSTQYHINGGYTDSLWGKRRGCRTLYFT